MNNRLCLWIVDDYSSMDNAIRARLQELEIPHLVAGFRDVSEALAGLEDYDFIRPHAVLASSKARSLVEKMRALSAFDRVSIAYHSNQDLSLLAEQQKVRYVKKGDTPALQAFLLEAYSSLEAPR